MKKTIVILSIIIFVLLVILAVFKDVEIHQLGKEVLSLEQIKMRLDNTQKIYICMYSDNTNSVCASNDVVRTIDDKRVIEEFIDIMVKLEESDNGMNKMRDNHTLYFVDGNNKVIVSAEFGYNFIIKTSNKEYILDPSANEQLRNLLDFSLVVKS